MKIAVRYQSHGGNTKEVALAIAKVANTTAESIEKSVDEQVDLLFVGGGVYKWGIDPSIKAFIEGLDTSLIKSVIVFSTAGGMNKTPQIIALAKEKGLSVREEALNILFGVRNHAWLGGKGNVELSEKQTRTIHDFVKKMIDDTNN